MTLSDAVKQFEARFSEVVQPSKVDEDPSLPLICSGGEVEVRGVLPALYSSEELAVGSWLVEANKQYSKVFGPHEFGVEPILDWVYRPELVELQMTMMDRLGQQRLVTKRYAVKSQMRVK